MDEIRWRRWRRLVFRNLLRMSAHRDRDAKRIKKRYAILYVISSVCIFNATRNTLLQLSEYILEQTKSNSSGYPEFFKCYCCPCVFTQGIKFCHIYHLYLLSKRCSMARARGYFFSYYIHIYKALWAYNSFIPWILCGGTEKRETETVNFF